MFPQNPPQASIHQEGSWKKTRKHRETTPYGDQTGVFSQIPRDGIWLRLAQTFASTISRSAHAQRLFSNRQFYSSFQRWTAADVTLLQIALELLYTTRGQVHMDALAVHCCLSLRQFERRFQRCMGITPKTFARLLRFEAVRDSLIRDSSSVLKETASQFGYQDQAHLIHEFNIWAGCTPGMFLTRAAERGRSGYLLLPDPRRALTNPDFHFKRKVI